MTFETFQQVILTLKEDSEQSRKLYKLGFDDINFKDRLHSIITLLLRAHYSKDGEDIISWWLWEDVEKFLYDSDGNKTDDLTKVEDLWKYIEQIRLSPDFQEYKPEKPKKRTKKQLQKLYKQLFT